MKKKGNEELGAYNFNEGRLNCDRKWVDAIKDRIEELEKELGIPELKRLMKDYKYKWKNDEEISEVGE